MGNPEHYLELAPQFDDDGAPVIQFTADDEANQLLRDDPNAFLLAVVLDQQIPAAKAFAGPAELKRRIGHLDPAKIAAIDAEDFLAKFREKPAIHRFPASMAKRVQDACATIAADYDNDASALWRDQPDAPTVMKRLGDIPGIGKTKQQLAVMLLGRYYGVQLEGWREHSPIPIPD